MSVLSQFMTGRRVAVFTSSTTWTVPPGVNAITIFGCGGGGGSSNTPGVAFGGGAGQIGLWVDLPIVGFSDLTIVIGAGGNPGAWGGKSIVYGSAVGGTSLTYWLEMLGGGPGSIYGVGSGGGATGLASVSYGGTNGGSSGNAFYAPPNPANRIGGIGIGRPKYTLGEWDTGLGYGCGGSVSPEQGTPSAGQQGVVFIIY